MWFTVLFSVDPGALAEAEEGVAVLEKAVPGVVDVVLAENPGGGGGRLEEALPTEEVVGVSKEREKEN